MDLATAGKVMICRKFNVVLERTARELAGVSCLELDEPDPAKQEICCSRMFGKRMSEIGPIKEAVATYTARAAEKLRAQGSVCKKMRVSVRTDMFNPDKAKYANGVVIELPYATNDTLLMTSAATHAVDHIFSPGYRYSKAEVMLLDLRQPGEYTGDLFALTQPQTSDRLMAVMDSINSRWGRGTLRAATVPATPEWAMRRDLMSQSYTTRFDQLWIARAH